jgi:glycine cleavage system transcriptional repressor
MSKQQYLVVTLNAAQTHAVVADFIHACATTECNIIEMRMIGMGSEHIVNAHVCGDWSAIAKLEGQLEKLEEKTEIKMSITRTEPQELAKGVLPYMVHVTSQDGTNMVQLVSAFFSHRDYLILDMTVARHMAAQTQTVMQSLNMTLFIPLETPMADFREAFIVFCDEHNFDAIFEPDRT